MLDQLQQDLLAVILFHVLMKIEYFIIKDLFKQFCNNIISIPLNVYVIRFLNASENAQ